MRWKSLKEISVFFPRTVTVVPKWIIFFSRTALLSVREHFPFLWRFKGLFKLPMYQQSASLIKYGERLETEAFLWMVMVALWALFCQIRQNSSFGFIFLDLLLDWWSLPGRGLLTEQNGGHGCHRLLSQNICCHWS